MNPGISEEVGKVATTTVEALKQTPMVLALVIFNILFMAMVGYLFLKSSARWDAEAARMHTLVASTLAACSDKFKLQSNESEIVDPDVLDRLLGSKQLRRDASKPEQIPDLSVPKQ